MDKLQHTPTPWRVSGNGTMRFIDASVGNGVAQEVATCMRVEHGDMEANARRIVACVNACEGLTTEYLETIGLPEFVGKTLCADLAQQELERVTARREQLLTSPRIVRTNVGSMPGPDILMLDGTELDVAAARGDK